MHTHLQPARLQQRRKTEIDLFFSLFGGGPRQSWALPFVFQTVTYGSNRGFTLMTGLPLGLSLFPDKGKRCPSGKDREVVLFLKFLNQGFSVRGEVPSRKGKGGGGRFVGESSSPSGRAAAVTVKPTPAPHEAVASPTIPPRLLPS